MAYKIIRPRRGRLSEWLANKTRIYKKGEMLVVSPETGVGTGGVGIKFGDGETDFEHLPYALQSPFIINIATEDGTTYTADKTHAEALEAFNNGKLVYFKVPAHGMVFLAVMVVSDFIASSGAYNNGTTNYNYYIFLTKNDELAFFLPES